MRASNILLHAMNFNPIVDTMFESIGFQIPAPIPPSSEFIVMEDGITQIITEDGALLITES